MNVEIDKDTCINSPKIENDPVYDALPVEGVTLVDAQHIFVATKQACISFLTCDRGILHRAQRIKEFCGIEIRKSSAFVSAETIKKLLQP